LCVLNQNEYVAEKNGTRGAGSILVSVWLIELMNEVKRQSFIRHEVDLHIYWNHYPPRHAKLIPEPRGSIVHMDLKHGSCARSVLRKELLNESTYTTQLMRSEFREHGEREEEVGVAERMWYSREETRKFFLVGVQLRQRNWVMDARANTMAVQKRQQSIAL
jgi:hypothetical protein